MMKITVTLLSAAVAVSAAHGHRHGHQHFHNAKRQATPAVDVVTVPGPTEVIYVLNGLPIPESEVQQGLRNGSLVIEDGGELASVSSVTSTSAPPPPSTTTSSVSTPKPTTSSQAPAPQSSSASSGVSGGTGVNSVFPNNQLSCDTFPEAYGAIPVSWTGLGGWTGIQKPASQGLAGFADIVTAIFGSSCTEGSYCSYACPAGYQKTQWPTSQGSTGQSVGGLLCSGGKLQLTNPSLSNKLCMTGVSNVVIQVQNNLSQNVAVCRTDYPGTESETVPVNVMPGSTEPLACPDSANYYTWEGGKTSAQYYVNPAGVSVEDACTWGSSANPWGNFAPLNVGVGWSNNAAWLSIFQNSPTTNAKLPFTVTLVGDSMSGSCRYSNGQYCSGENFSDCSSTTGCTVSLSSGTATFVFSD